MQLHEILADPHKADQRIADLEAQLAHKDAVIEVLADYIDRIEWTLPTMSLPDDYKTFQTWKQWAEAKAKEAE